MAELSKIDSKVTITDKLSAVRSALSKLDKTTAAAEKAEGDLAELKRKESALLKDATRTDKDKLSNLLSIRAEVDLKQSTVNSFRGEGSKGNNVAKVPGSIENAEKAVHNAAADAARFLNAFHDATKVRLREAILEATAAFFRPEDGEEIMNLASRSYNVRQIHLFDLPVFHKDHILGYANDVRLARSIDNTWSDLLAAADAIGGELAVSVPDPWLEESAATSAA